MNTDMLHQLWAMAQQMLPAAYLHKGAEVVGWLALIGGLAPKLIAWGLPAATLAADRVATLVIAYVPKPVVAYVLPGLVKFLDDMTDALEQVMNTFKNRLEADLKASQAAAPAVPPKPEGQP